MTAQVATPAGSRIRGFVDSASADVTEIEIDRPRVAAEADGRIPNAFISNATALSALSVPSSAVTTASGARPAATTPRCRSRTSCVPPSRRRRTRVEQRRDDVAGGVAHGPGHRGRSLRDERQTGPGRERVAILRVEHRLRRGDRSEEGRDRDGPRRRRPGVADRVTRRQADVVAAIGDDRAVGAFAVPGQRRDGRRGGAR